MSSTHSCLLLSAVLTLSPALLGQQPDQSPSPAINLNQAVPTIKVNSRLVVLDVVVSDGYGTPVKGLSPSDFTLLEDGVPQKITGFTEHDAADVPAAPRPAALPPNTFSVQPQSVNGDAMTAIVISANGAQFFSVLDQLRSYLKSSVPQTPVAIFRMDWQGMHLVQDFTSDHEALLQTVYSKRIEPPLGFQVGPYSHAAESPTHILARYLSGFPGRINVLWFSAGNVNADTTREFPDVASFAQDLRQTGSVTRLNPIALYFADATGVAVRAIQWTSFDLNVDEMSFLLGYPSDLGKALEDNRNSPGSMQNEMIKLNTDKQLFSTASPLSPPTGPSFDGCIHSSVAEATGGAAFCNTNGFKEVIAKVVSTGSHYYTVSYQPANADWDGAYRKISVAVKGLDKLGPPPASTASESWHQLTGYGTVQQPKLEYRRGYYARTPSLVPWDRASDTPASLPSAAAPAVSETAPAKSGRRLLSASSPGDPGPYAVQLQHAMAFGSPAPGDTHFTVVVSGSPTKAKIGRNDVLPPANFLTAAFRDKSFRNLHLHFWVDPADLHFVRGANGRYRDDLRFVTLVYRDDGVAANSLSTRSHIEVSAEQLEDIQNTGITLDQVVAIPVEGFYFIRAGVQDSATGHTGALEIPADEIKLSSDKSLAQNTPPR